MDYQIRITSVLAAVGLLAAGATNAALIDGIADASNNTSVFISVVERNSVNQVVRNLVIDTGARTLDTLAGTPWSTSAGQEAAILQFAGSIQAGSSVFFNIGGALTDLSFATDLRGFLTSGSATGPGATDFTALDSGIGNHITFIADANTGTFSSDGVLASAGDADPGWHVTAWDNSVGGAIQPSNEILLGAGSEVVGWRLNLNSFEIERAVVGLLTSNLSSGDISFDAAAPVPLPAAAWLLAPMAGLLTPWVKRRRKD